MIYDPAEHESLADDEWDAPAARDFVVRVVREADATFDPERRWPLHPEDDYGETVSGHGVYSGTAGSSWALVRLAERHGVALRHDFGAVVARSEAAYRAVPTQTDTVVPSYFLGTTGIMAARYALSGDAAILDRLAADVRANVGNVAREALWGSPGSALAALLVRERDGDDRFDAALRATQDELVATWISPGEPGALLWRQDLYGKRCCFVGAAHGAIGNLAPLLRAPDLLTARERALVAERVPALLEAYALRDGAAANWACTADPLEGRRLQWCHGSAGVVTALAWYPAEDERVERLLLAGGEAIWTAGPLRKGPTICHGTAGNGFALLRLAQRSGDARWRVRAERFALHAMRQADAWHADFGMPSVALWTGGLGVALFVDAVLSGDPALLSLDVM